MIANSNIKFINYTLCDNENADIISVLFDTSDFVTKSNVDLVSETITTILDNKKNKNVPLVKLITKKDVFANGSEDGTRVCYTHNNKYVEKYKVINTTFNTTKFDEGNKVDSIYVIAVIPYNGTMIKFDIDNVAGGTVEVVAARSVSTHAIKMNKQDKVLYSKLCYLVIKVDPIANTADYSGFDINFTTESYRWSDDRTSCTRIARDIVFYVSSDFVADDSITNASIKPEVKETNTYLAELTNDGRIATPSVKFNSLFKIKLDKTIKSDTERKPYKSNNNFNKNKNRSSNDVVKNYFASNRNNNVSNENQSRRSKRFEDAKRRYSEDDYE